jgi:hypothetical protein
VTLEQPALGLWISPFNPYQTAAAVAADARKVHMPGMQTRVLLPTLYDDYPQQVVTRTIGDALAIDNAEDAAAVRAAIEAEGTPCDGWSVPRGTGDIEAEGYAHGLVASKFERFVLNWEEGWSGFWTENGAAAVNLWMTGFWRAVSDAGAAERLQGRVGITFVTNLTMRNAATDDEVAAWVGGSHYDALEAYLPGDPGLDPGKALAIWQGRLARIGATDRPVVVILEHGDLPALVAQYAHPTYGAQVWTLPIAASQNWPPLESFESRDPESEPEPEPSVDPRDTQIAAMAGAIAHLADVVGDALLAEAKRSSVRKTFVRSQVAEMQRVRKQYVGPRP